MRSGDDSTFYRFLVDLGSALSLVRDETKALKIALRQTLEAFGADEGCIAVLPRGRHRAELRFAQPEAPRWDLKYFGELLRGRHVYRPRNLLTATIQRRGSPWAAVAIRRRRQDFDRDEVLRMTPLGTTIARFVAQIDRERIAEVRARIDRKIMEELRPKDLFYQILHGLRSLTGYDHSAALLILDQSPGALELVAEQIAWKKRRSRRIGLTRPLDEYIQVLLEAGEVLGFDRLGGRWREWSGQPMSKLAQLLDFHEDGARENESLHEASMLCAPLIARGTVVGVMKVAACYPKTLGRFEAHLVRRFMPHVIVAILNQRRTESLEAGMLAAEKKHVMANLARGVSHDINNAFGSALPLVQQLAAEARDGQVDPEVLRHDLAQIEESLQVCRRIFGGMLSFARGAHRRTSESDLRRAVENTLAILQESMRRHSIKATTDIDGALPAVPVAQGDLEQLVLNLVTNARDAMPEGGVLSISARPRAEEVELIIEDSGVGITPEQMRRVYEPFFTTKRRGNGLGLSICRSILWNLKGRMEIDSKPDSGTRVWVRLPARTAKKEEEIRGSGAHPGSG